MPPDLPLPPSESNAACKPRRWWSFFCSTGALKIGFFSTVFPLTGLIFYVVFLSPYSPRPPAWYLPSLFDSNSSEIADPNGLPLVDLATLPPEPTRSSPTSDVLTLEQIRDVVAPTRGFFTRDYSLHLGWNNVRYIFEAALLQADLLNRTLVLPSFVYARACEYNITVCADYATMVNKGDAIGSDEWREMPIEQQMGFRVPISVMVNMTHLRNRQPVITVSEYLRLHGQDPESESSSGYWSRESYHTHPNVFETDKTKTPSLFVIENYWYDPDGTTRVDYIPEAMKRRGKLERHPGPDNYDGSNEYWPPMEPTELSEAMRWQGPQMDWITAKSILMYSPEVIGNANLDDDAVVEKVLNAHGWEVLHIFENEYGTDIAKTIVNHFKEVVRRSSIRGFKDDYHDVDADVIMLSGEAHTGRGPGGMHFTEEQSRRRFANTVVHSLVPPQKILDIAEVLSSRMRLLTEGRMWMGTHMRRGDFVVFGWAMELDINDHIRRVKQGLQAGRSVLVDLHYRRDWRAYDLDGTKLDPEQTTLPPPSAQDPFFVATDERDPDARRKISGAGAVFVSDLLTMEDRQAFGWPLMITDVMAVVEQQALVHSDFFYGFGLSSLAGAVFNWRAARGADPRTMVLD